MNLSNLDHLDEATLRRRGSLKWTEFAGKIGAFIAEMDFGVAPVVRDAVETALRAHLTGYLPAAVRERHAHATTGWMLDRYGWQVQPERVRPLGDVIACFDVAIRKFSLPDTPVIVPTPAYPPFLQVPRELGREVVEVPMLRTAGRWVIDLDVLDRALTPRGGLLVLCNPSNPTGTVYTRTELLAIAELVERHGGRVFADEVHAPLILEPDLTHVPYASVSAAAAAHAVTGTSAAKAWNIAGLKCAQLILSNDADAERWQRECVRWENAASVLGVVANTAAYEAGADWLDEVLALLRSNRTLLSTRLAEQLPGIHVTVPQGTYLSWLDCAKLQLPESGTPAKFWREQADVALIDGADCGTGFDTYVRFNFAMPPQLIDEAVRRMRQAAVLQASRQHLN